MKHSAEDPDRTLTGVILAGGRASRMGGEDKGLLAFCGQPLAAHSLRRLRPQVDRLVIVANRNQDEYRKLNQNVISDPADVGEYLGPLAGMLAALSTVPGLVLTAPCDSPLLADDYAARMYQRLLQDEADVVVAAGPDAGARRLQPVFALVPSRLAEDLRAYLRGGGRKIDRWLGRHRLAVADFSDRPEMFVNVNTPQELRELERRYLAELSAESTPDPLA